MIKRADRRSPTRAPATSRPRADRQHLRRVCPLRPAARQDRAFASTGACEPPKAAWCSFDVDPPMLGPVLASYYTDGGGGAWSDRRRAIRLPVREPVPAVRTDDPDAATEPNCVGRAVCQTMDRTSRVAPSTSTTTSGPRSDAAGSCYVTWRRLVKTGDAGRESFSPGAQGDSQGVTRKRTSRGAWEAHSERTSATLPAAPTHSPYYRRQ